MKNTVLNRFLENEIIIHIINNYTKMYNNGQLHCVSPRQFIEDTHHLEDIVYREAKMAVEKEFHIIIINDVMTRRVFNIAFFTARNWIQGYVGADTINIYLNHGFDRFIENKPDYRVRLIAPIERN